MHKRVVAVEPEHVNSTCHAVTNSLWLIPVTEALVEQDRSEAFYRNIWERILKLAKSSGDKRWQERATAELGFIAFMEGDVQQATSMLKTAIISLYLQADLGAAIYYGSIVGNGMVETGNPEAGMKYCDTAIKMAADIKDMGFPFMAYEGKTTMNIYTQAMAPAKRKAIRKITQKLLEA